MSEDRIPQYQPKQNCGSNGGSSDQEAQEQRLRERVSAIEHQILVLSGKGGVGKSTVAANLAWALALRDYRVGLLDADINGPTIPLMTGLQDIGASGLGGFTAMPVMEHFKVMSMSFFLEDPDTPTIWRGPLKGGIIRQFIADVDWGPLDYLVVDLPPGTGDEPLTVAQCFPEADGGIIVTTPQEASLAVCRKAVNFLKAVKLPCLGVIENMSGFVCPHCGEVTDVFASGGGEDMARNMDVPFLGRLPLAPEIVRLSDAGQPLLGAAASPTIRAGMEAIVVRLLAASPSPQE
jgi:ATP-binding protein involved in chromosome partitioning